MADVDGLFVGLIAFGIVVIVGVTLEGWEHLIDIRTKGWRPVVPKLGFAILFIGLVGEVYCDNLIGRAEAVFQQGAIAKLNKSADALLKESETARLEEEKVRASNWLLANIFLSRRVTVSFGPNGPNGKEFATLKKFAGTKVVILSVPDLEAVQLAADIAGALRTANWKEEKVAVLPFADAYPLIGVYIVIGIEEYKPKAQKESPALRDAAWALLGYLLNGYLKDLGLPSSAGIDVRTMPLPKDQWRPGWWPHNLERPYNALYILVGRKDFTEQLDKKSWFEQLPERYRRWFLSHNIPFAQ